MMNYHKHANYLIHVHKSAEEGNDLTKIIEDFHKSIQIIKSQPVLKNFVTIFYENDVFFHKFNIDHRNVHKSNKERRNAHKFIA